MEQKTNNKDCEPKNKGGAPEAIYGLGIIGAAVYYIQHADSFWIGVIGILKALLWPAFLIYKLFVFLNL